jgi:signal transduction histidine kinase/ActR/RegA family two-component response regulator
MKIRSQLVVLVIAAIAPVAILATITTLQLWQLQREASEQRFLERVSALRLALDTELEGTIRTLRSLADSADFDPGAGALQAHTHFERLTLHGRAWITMGLVEAQGDPLVRADREGAPQGMKLDEATARAVLTERAPAISNLVAFDDGRTLVTFIAVPVLRKGVLNGIVYVGIEHLGWLDFLNHYPIAKHTTLTLNDRNGTIITRTLNDDQWAGKRSSATYWDRTVGKAEGVFQSVGLEGQPFYSAFSRSEQAGWVLGTGVPREEVEAGLSVPTTLLGLGIVAVIVLASLLALLLGRRVADTVTALADSAKSMAGPKRPTGTAPLPIVEAETVRIALDEAAVKLDARERSVNQALDREARSRAAAEHANQAKDQFIAMLGHELRNPLSAISAAVTVLDMTTRDLDAQRRARDIVRRQLRHLTDIVNDLLDVSRLTIGKVVLNRRPLDLQVVVQNVIASFRDSGRCEHVSIESALTPVSVIGDETRIEQVVGNLLDNACKYTPPGGHIVVSVEAVGNEAHLRVRDDGSGIAPDLLPNVFDLFAQGERTIDRAQGGLGLGLAVVRRLVELHGGSVAVESAGTNRGSTFIVRLPMTETQPGVEGTSAARPALPTRRIVLVEDNPDSRDVVSTLLRMKGHDVKIAVDGPEGLEAIGSTDVDIALVDIGLPGFDGAELARRVREQRLGGRDLILIALTGYGTPEDRASALEAGFDAFLVKPFDLHAFETAVASAEQARAAIRSQ